MEKQKTAVEFLRDTLYPYFDKEDREYTNILFNKAKEMEKEQIRRAYYTGGDDIKDNPDREADKYYKETFKSE